MFNRTQQSVGIWSILPCPSLVEVIASAGLDFIILDMEHGTYDIAAVEQCVRAAELHGCLPFVRVPGADLYKIQGVLDVGCKGVFAPQIQTAEQAELFVRMLRYGPAGVRGLNPFTRAGGFGKHKPVDDCLAGVLLENTSLYDQLDDVLKIEALDAVYLGVYDMSVSLGHPGEIHHADVESFVEDAAKRIRKAGKTVGAMVKSRQEYEKLALYGVNMFVYSVDTSVIHRAILAAVNDCTPQR